jgi:hypothetical protein
MTNTKRFPLLLSALAMIAFAAPAVAMAQDTTPEDTDKPDHDPDETPATPGATAPPNDGDLPPPQSDDDPAPEVAAPGVPPGGIVKQAGIGGPIGYGRAGVLELGGSAGFTLATDLTQLNVSPSVGWFLADNFQISAILGVTHVGTDQDSSTFLTGLVEPSYHLPFNRSTFGFFGLGVGASWVEDLGGGFAMAPRLGANVMVGRSGVLTPSVSWQYTTHDTEEGQDETTLVAVSSALRLNIGYTVMW